MAHICHSVNSLNLFSDFRISQFQTKPSEAQTLSSLVECVDSNSVALLHGRRLLSVIIFRNDIFFKIADCIWAICAYSMSQFILYALPSLPPILFYVRKTRTLLVNKYFLMLNFLRSAKVCIKCAHIASVCLHDIFMHLRVHVAHNSNWTDTKCCYHGSLPHFISFIC